MLIISFSTNSCLVAPLESEEISEIAPVQIERANDQKDYANFNIEKLLQQHKLLTQWESKFVSS